MICVLKWKVCWMWSLELSCDSRLEYLDWIWDREWDWAMSWHEQTGSRMCEPRSVAGRLVQRASQLTQESFSKTSIIQLNCTFICIFEFRSYQQMSIRKKTAERLFAILIELEIKFLGFTWRCNFDRFWNEYKKIRE